MRVAPRHNNACCVSHNKPASAVLGCNTAMLPVGCGTEAVGSASYNFAYMSKNNAKKFEAASLCLAAREGKRPQARQRCRGRWH